MQASDGTTGDIRGWYKVVVTVTDVEENGKIALTVGPDGSATPGDQDLLQFQPGALLIATLTDGDGGISGLTWEWSGKGLVTDPADEDNSAYAVKDTPANESDVGKRLTVTAKYNDRRGDGKIVTFSARNPVQVSRADGDNTNPEYPLESIIKSLAEDATEGTTISIPTATDANGDILTYSLERL